MLVTINYLSVWVIAVQPNISNCLTKCSYFSLVIFTSFPGGVADITGDDDIPSKLPFLDQWSQAGSQFISLSVDVSSLSTQPTVLFSAGWSVPTSSNQIISLFKISYNLFLVYPVDWRIYVADLISEARKQTGEIRVYGKVSYPPTCSHRLSPPTTSQGHQNKEPIG